MESSWEQEICTFWCISFLESGQKHPSSLLFSGRLPTLTGCPGLAGRTHTAKRDSAAASLAQGAQAEGEWSWAGSTCTLAPSKAVPARR